MKILIIGKGQMLANLIRGAMLANCEIAGILRYENLYLSPFMLFLHDMFTHSPELTLIKNHKLTDLKFKSANSDKLKNFIIKNNIDVLMVGTWPEKIKKDIFNSPKIGTINVHPSLLPKYRGPNPYLQTILNGEKTSGVTFHLMTDKLDAGPILAQEEVEILPTDTGKELRDRTVFKARLLCEHLLNQLKQGCVDTIWQDENKATYFKDIEPEKMTLDFKNETSDEIYRHIRAFYPFRPTYIDDGNNFWIVNPYKIRFTDLTEKPNTIIKNKKGSLLVACNDKKVIEFFGLKKY